MASFEWSPGSSPPPIEEHSLAKLSVFRDYLSSYIERLCVGSPRDEFKLDLVDGFCGGGLFAGPDGDVSGTPLIMLEEAQSAYARLNTRRLKPLNFDLKFHFNDVNPDHVQYLHGVLAERCFYIPDHQVCLYPPSHFRDVVENIISEIGARQPRSGRSLFLLDQTGFNQVDLVLIRKIFDSLPNAEVILTFSVDTLVNHMAETPSYCKALEPLGIDDSMVLSLLAEKDRPLGRAFVQRSLRGHIRALTGCTFDTAFFIRPKNSRRALWFLHLSRHPIARDVMAQCHWRNYNSFEHYGTGGFDMMGWDPLKHGPPPLFDFSKFDEGLLHQELVATLPEHLSSAGISLPMSVNDLRFTLANSTAGRFEDLDRAVLTLFRERDFDILTQSGKLRSREITRLSPSDRISFSISPMFPGWPGPLAE